MNPRGYISVKEVLQYKTTQGKRPFEEWLLSLKDKTVEARIFARLDRLQVGNFGDIQRVGSIWELRFHFGPGYRVYLGKDREKLAILLCGGDKSTQTSDIRRAKEYWKDYLERKP